MANKTNPRRKGKRKTERLTSKDGMPRSCGGEGHNGAIGKAKWKALSRRAARRAKPGQRPGISKRGKPDALPLGDE